MISLPILGDFSFIRVDDAGVPNRERIVFRPTTKLNLGEFVLIVGVQTGVGLLSPVRDLMFWFGEEFVEPPWWVFVYTGTGTRQNTMTTDSREPALVLHWGREQTVFTADILQPVLVRLGGILSPMSPGGAALLPAPISPEATYQPESENEAIRRVLNELAKTKKG